MDIYDELKKSKDFVYSIKGENFIIGYGVFLDCPSNIKNLYDDFIEKVEKLVSEIEKNFPEKRFLNYCIESFNTLMKAIFEITYNNMSDDYRKKLCSFVDNLTMEEKEEIKHQRELYIFFLELDLKDKLNFDILLNDLYRLKELK